MKKRHQPQFVCIEVLSIFILIVYGLPQAFSQERDQQLAIELPSVYKTNFDSAEEMGRWEFSDDGWKLNRVGDVTTLSQFRKQSKLQTKVRSPFHRAILIGHEVSDFQLDVRVLSTNPSYNHRDVCIFFGYQSPSNFYYVHLGQETDPHCNQVFIVNDKDREKITRSTNDGTPWDDKFHDVRIVRDSNSGSIEIYFDDFQKPVMTAIDKTFTFGRVGLGSFDDTAEWAQFRLRGIQTKD